MNSTNNDLTDAIIDTIIQETYASNILNRLFFSSITLLYYATLLKLSQEVEHIWFKAFRSFSLPTWLHIFARYGPLIQQGLILSTYYVSEKKTCALIIHASSIFSFLSYIGIQGLLVARAYSLCQSKIPTVALALGFLSSLILQLYVIITFPGCTTSISAKNSLIQLGSNICIIFIDIVIFGNCMWKVWDAWKTKQGTGIQNRRSLVSILTTQSISRLCFVTVISITCAVLSGVQNSSPLFGHLAAGCIYLQNALSSILVADFTLDLRNLNSAQIEASHASLSPFQFSNVLGHVHESFIVELSTPGNVNVEEDGHDNSGPDVGDIVDEPTPTQEQDI